jgi:hypothetical protein
LWRERRGRSLFTRFLHPQHGKQVNTGSERPSTFGGIREQLTDLEVVREEARLFFLCFFDSIEFLAQYPT